MRYCFYHTDLGHNAVFHNFAIQIALIQYSGRSKHAWAFSYKTGKKNSKITYTATRFSLLLVTFVHFRLFNPYTSSKVKNENDAIQIRFPTLTIDVFLNQKPTTHE